MNHCLIWDLKSVAAKAATAAMVPMPLIPNTLYTQPPSALLYTIYTPNAKYLIPITQYLALSTQYLMPNTQFLIQNTQYLSISYFMAAHGTPQILILCGIKAVRPI